MKLEQQLGVSLVYFSASVLLQIVVLNLDSQVADSSFVSTSIKPLQTQRPFTPREKERILFGRKAKSNRPPSSFRYLLILFKLISKLE